MIESELAYLPLPGHKDSSDGSDQRAFLVRVGGGWKERIGIANRADVRGNRFDGIDHPRCAAGIENIGRQ
jgi:hypothetical protein